MSNGIVLDRTIFYATSGGQPGDLGALVTASGAQIPVANTIYLDQMKTEIAHVPAPGAPPLSAGDKVAAQIDWDKRYARMRMHTALHLLSAVLPYAVTGGSVGDTESRLDFDIPEAGLDKDAITARLAEMIAADAAVTSRWISDEELAANPGLVKDHVGEAADGHRQRAADRDRRGSIFSHAAARMSARPARSAKSRSPRSRRRASRTAACGSRSSRKPAAPVAECREASRTL